MPLAAAARHAALGAGLVLLAFALAGCGRNSHTSDSHLRELDGILNRDLPQGTPMARVIYYLRSRGHSIEPPPSRDTVVAVVHHVNVKPLEMVTARVTFHFDLHGKLTTYEITAAP